MIISSFSSFLLFVFLSFLRDMVQNFFLFSSLFVFHSFVYSLFISLHLPTSVYLSNPFFQSLCLHSAPCMSIHLYIHVFILLCIYFVMHLLLHFLFVCMLHLINIIGDNGTQDPWIQEWGGLKIMIKRNISLGKPRSKCSSRFKQTVMREQKKKEPQSKRMKNIDAHR